MYDVIIVGLGPAGIACARECKLRNPKANILVLEQGCPISKRRCPAQETGGKCINCTVCGVMSGTGGAGANSDGKFTMPQKKGLYHIGGSLPRHIGLDETNQLVFEQHKNNCAKGAPNNIVAKRNNAFVCKLDEQLENVGLYRAEADVNHIGTSAVRELYQAYEDELKELEVEIRFNTSVKDLIMVNHHVSGVVTSKNEELTASHIVLATGRSGSKWIEAMCNEYDITVETEEVDFGFRIEVPTSCMKEINDNLYEAKIIGRYGDVQVRMFCTNPDGQVVTESAEGIKYVNGHSDNKALSENTNFAVLANYSLAIPRPSDAVRNVARLINEMGKGQPVIQRWEDIVNGVATTKEGLRKNSLKPSLKSAYPGDMTGLIPEKALNAIKMYMADLGKVIPGIDGPDTIAYGLEAKFCHSGIELNNELLCNVGAYIIGDAGCTHGLASAAASGIYVARCIFR